MAEERQPGRIDAGRAAGRAGRQRPPVPLEPGMCVLGHVAFPLTGAGLGFPSFQSMTRSLGTWKDPL